MNSSAASENPSSQSARPIENRCQVCDYPIKDICFCRIHNKEAGPILLCSPDCTFQYFHSKGAPLAEYERERLEDSSKSFWFIGEEKPWG